MPENSHNLHVLSVGGDGCRYPQDVPQQYNGCDCGVFALEFADYASRAAPLTFSQKHMKHFRRKIASDIVALHVA